MKRIITLTGHKNCGKLEIAMDLAKNSDVHYIKPYSDRKYPIGEIPERYGDFHVVSSDKLDKMIESDELLCMSVINDNRYCFFKSQLQEGYNVLIVDDYALADMRGKYDDIYSVKVKSKNQKDSSRVGVYLYDHEFNEVFNYDTDDVSELEWRIGYDCEA